MPVPQAGAAEIIVTAIASERLEANTNRDLEKGGRPVYGSTTRLGFEVEALTGPSTLSLSAGLSGTAFTGPGDTDGLTGINPDFGLGYAYEGKRVDFGTDITLDFQPASFAQLEESGVTTGDATQVTTQLNATLAYKIDPRNRLSLTGNGRVVRFNRGTTTLNPTTTLGLDLTWTRDVTPRTSFDLTFGATRFTVDKGDGDGSLSFDLTPGITHRVNNRLSFQGGLGVSATKTDGNTNDGSGGGYDFGLVGNLKVDWQPFAASSVALTVSHGIEPSDVGTLRSQTSLGLTFSHAVNSWANVGLDMSWRRRWGGSGSGSTNADKGDLFWIGPSIEIKLARNWQLAAGYTLVHKSDDTSDATSNLVFVTLTRNFDILRR